MRWVNYKQGTKSSMTHRMSPSGRILALEKFCRRRASYFGRHSAPKSCQGSPMLVSAYLSWNFHRVINKVAASPYVLGCSWLCSWSLSPGLTLKIQKFRTLPGFFTIRVQRPGRKDQFSPGCDLGLLSVEYVELCSIYGSQQTQATFKEEICGRKT